MANWDTGINFNNSKNKKTFTNWNNENPENWRKTNDENCGFKCKLGKSFLGVKESIKKAQDDSRRKKADRFGVSLADYDKAVKQAKSVGKKKAYNSFLKDVEKKEYLIKPNKGGKSTKSTIDQILDSFAGTQTKPRRTTTKRTTPRRTTTKQKINSDGLMDIENNIWSKYGWRSAGDINQDVYEKEVNKRILKKYNVSKRDLDILTDNNLHTLRDVIERNKPIRRKTRRKTPSRAGKFTIVGGIAYPVATNKTKKRRKQRSKSKRNQDFFSF